MIMALYQLGSTPLGDFILRTSDEAYIPLDLGNSDYRDYLAWVALGNTPDPAPAAAPSTVAASTLAPKLAAGIALTCTGNSSLNATYALDSASTAQIFQIGLYAAQFSVFPSGNSTQSYPDMSGNQHVFDVTQFVAFLRAVAPLVSNLETQAALASQGGTPTWPVQSATIP